MKLLLFSACVILAFSSCKKESKTTTTTTATLSATIGGVNETFNSSLTAQSIYNNPGYTIGITGFRGAGTNPDGLQLAVNSDKPIAKGVYTISSQTSTDPSNLPLIIYYKSTGTFGTDVSGVNVTTITITSISSANVQGTFSGVLISETGDNTTQTITDGKFNVNITTK